MNSSMIDMLVRIRNAYLARRKEAKIPYSLVNFSLGKLLVKEGFLEDIEVKENKKMKKRKEIFTRLKFLKRKPVLSDIKIVSKPSLRVYVSRKKIPRVQGGFGVAILSTPKGLMTGQQAKKQDLGGELLFEVW